MATQGSHTQTKYCSDDALDLSGVWLSTYSYSNDARISEYKHYVRLSLQGRELIVQSTPTHNYSRMSAQLTLSGRIATGVWQDAMLHNDGVKETSYRGAAQLIFGRGWKSLQGKWVGFGQNLDIKSGPWEIKYVGKTLPKEPLE